MAQSRRTTLLIVLDGWGYNPSPVDNAIAAARTPHWDSLWENAPHTLISGSGTDVGLPPGQMGNSEVGHMSLGAGRVIYQDLTRISHAIETGEFAANPVLQRAIEAARGGTLHLMGLLSPGGVHSHEDHFAAMIDMAAAAGLTRIVVHAFLDGRDTPPRSARESLEKIDSQLRALGVGRIASICGRYFAMDRDQRWDRVERAYNMLVQGEAPFHASTVGEALEAAYARNENDEFVQPTLVHEPSASPGIIADDDVVVFMNFRADRARQISRAFVSNDFSGFTRKRRPQLADYVMLTRYADDIEASCAFEQETPANTLGEHLSDLGLTQLRIAETEKYAHVTFFFSGGREELFPGEERVLIPSPKVATYDLQPEMSAVEVTDKLIEALESRRFDAIICNFANGDMVGHTGIFDAAVAAVETLDACLGRIVDVIKRTDSQCLITADHGNVEQMKDPQSGQVHTAHTCEPVPLVYVGPHPIKLRSGGRLTDVAPTMLSLMELPVPSEMTGRSLVEDGARIRRSA